MIITHHREKLINAIVYFSKNTKFCYKTKLLKLLYFLDFLHFRQTGRSVTGLKYYAWEKGPVANTLYEEFKTGLAPDLSEAIRVVKSEKSEQIYAKRSFDDQYFSNRELKLLERLSFIFKDANSADMIESTHLRNQPWDKTKATKGMFEEIDYLLAIDDEKGSMPLLGAQLSHLAQCEMHNNFGYR